tara:strand:- start:185 stop:850 length:666 start_codon:yes stop_codon:yes gene_type:complete
MRNFYLVLFFAVSIEGCALIDTSKIAPGYSQAFKSISNLYSGYTDSINSSIIANIPYASMKLRFGNGPTGLIILESFSNKKYSWVSEDGVILITRNGKIIQTAGLSNNIKSSILPFNNELIKLINDKDTTTFKGYLSFTDPSLNELEVLYNYHDRGYVDVLTTFGSRNLRLIEEVFYSPTINWKGTNKYWVDKNFFVWVSEQKISPRLPNVFLEVTKKPSE